ncbi:MAG: AMP-binding protein [Elusimicrobia bacterium]|nr:AMP-binding protein [Elusimicrobiota bacterium]
MKLLPELLKDSAERRPNKASLVCGERRVSYGELDEASGRLAAALRIQGVRRGDRVACYLGNTPEAVIALFGILKAAAVFVPVNRAAKPDTLIAVLNQSGAVALLTDPRALAAGLSGRLAAEVPALRLVAADVARLASGPRLELPTQGIDVDLACILYTSGTNGEPKGVMCDHSGVEFVTRSIAAYLKLSERDILLSVLPLAHSYGFYQLLPAVCAGATLVLEDSFAFPEAVLEKMAAERVTGFAGVPTIFSMLLDMDLSRFDLSSLRYLTNAAAGLPVEHVRRLRTALPGAELFLMHGLTEVARTMYLPPEQVERRPDSCGVAIPGTELWLEDESGRRLGPGEVGELVVRGRNVMRGYWMSPEATGRRFVPGPLAGERVCRSGDLFRADADGYFYFVSRKDDIIKCRGQKVAPREVEDVLYALHGVQDAAAVGVPDAVLGEAVKAVIVAPAGGLTAAEVIAHCKRYLEEFKVPREVEFRAELPKTGSGKVRRLDLR